MPERVAVTDSPWFWMMLFGVMAWLGIWAISHKYETREQRIEVKAIGRDEANARIARGEAVDPTRTTGPQTADNRVEQRPDDQWFYPDQYENDKSLGFLQWASFLVAVVGWGGLMMQILRNRELSSPETSSKNDSQLNTDQDETRT
jgi:hypothetical protein